MKSILTLVGLVVLSGCTPPDTTQTRKPANGGSHLFTEYCVDGVSYIVYYAGQAMSVKYNANTNSPEKCIND